MDSFLDYPDRYNRKIEEMGVNATDVGLAKRGGEETLKVKKNTP